MRGPQEEKNISRFWIFYGDKKIFSMYKNLGYFDRKNKNWRKKSYVISTPGIITPTVPHHTAPIRAISAGIAILGRHIIVVSPSE